MCGAPKTEGELEKAADHLSTENHHDWHKRAHWDRPQQASSRTRTINGRTMEERGDPAAVGREGSGENRGTFGTSAGVK